MIILPITAIFFLRLLLRYYPLGFCEDHLENMAQALHPLWAPSLWTPASHSLWCFKIHVQGSKVNWEFLQQNRILNNFSVSCTQPHLPTFHQQMRQKDGTEPLQASVTAKSLKDTGDRATPWLLLAQDWGNLRIKQPKQVSWVFFLTAY